MLTLGFFHIFYFNEVINVVLYIEENIIIKKYTLHKKKLKLQNEVTKF